MSKKTIFWILIIVSLLIFSSCQTIGYKIITKRQKINNVVVFTKNINYKKLIIASNNPIGFPITDDENFDKYAINDYSYHNIDTIWIDIYEIEGFFSNNEETLSEQLILNVSMLHSDGTKFMQFSKFGNDKNTFYYSDISKPNLNFLRIIIPFKYVPEKAEYYEYTQLLVEIKENNSDAKIVITMPIIFNNKAQKYYNDLYPEYY